MRHEVLKKLNCLDRMDSFCGEFKLEELLRATFDFEQISLVFENFGGYRNTG